MAMSVDLGERLEAFVNEMVASGRYNSKSEVLREGLRLVQDREARLAAFDAAIERGLAAADEGRVHDIEDVFERLLKRYQGKAKRDDDEL